MWSVGHLIKSCRLWLSLRRFHEIKTLVASLTVRDPDERPTALQTYYVVGNGQELRMYFSFWLLSIVLRIIFFQEIDANFYGSMISFLAKMIVNPI